jgi:hypothetical protein
MKRRELKKCPTYTRAQREEMLRITKASSEFVAPYRLQSFADIDEQFTFGLQAFTLIASHIRARTFDSLAAVAKAFREIRSEERFAVLILCKADKVATREDVIMIIDTEVLDLCLEERADEQTSEERAVSDKAHFEVLKKRETS